jgi:Zn-dependent M32 family carboxypeptidase
LAIANGLLFDVDWEKKGIYPSYTLGLVTADQDKGYTSN